MKEMVISLPRVRRPKISRRLVLRVAAVVVFVIVANAVLYQVQPEELGVVLRYGRYVRTTQPGLHLQIPLVETVFNVPVQRQLKQEFGFQRTGPDASNPVPEEATMVTGDLNVAMIQWIVQYRIADPYKYLFRVRSVDDTLRDLTEAVMRETVGDRTVTEVLTVGRPDMEARVAAELQRLVTVYQMGLTIEQVALQSATPPDPVKPAWDEVTQAQQQRDRRINEARAEYNKVIPRAKGEASQVLLQAEGYALDRVNTSKGDAARFDSVYAAYRKAPDVTRERLYLETMGRILPRIGNKLLVDKDAKGLFPLLVPNTLANTLGAGKAKAGGDR